MLSLPEITSHSRRLSNNEEMSISIDSTNSLIDLSTIEPRPSSSNFRAPLLSHDLLASTRLYPINEVELAEEDAGDVTIQQQSP